MSERKPRTNVLLAAFVAVAFVLTGWSPAFADDHATQDSDLVAVEEVAAPIDDSTVEVLDPVEDQIVPVEEVAVPVDDSTPEVLDPVENQVATDETPVLLEEPAVVPEPEPDAAPAPEPVVQGPVADVQANAPPAAEEPRIDGVINALFTDPVLRIYEPTQVYPEDAEWYYTLDGDDIEVGTHIVNPGMHYLRLFVNGVQVDERELYSLADDEDAPSGVPDLLFASPYLHVYEPFYVTPEGADWYYTLNDQRIELGKYHMSTGEYVLMLFVNDEFVTLRKLSLISFYDHADFSVEFKLDTLGDGTSLPYASVAAQNNNPTWGQDSDHWYLTYQRSCTGEGIYASGVEVLAGNLAELSTGGLDYDTEYCVELTHEQSGLTWDATFTTPVKYVEPVEPVEPELTPVYPQIPMFWDENGDAVEANKISIDPAAECVQPIQPVKDGYRFSWMAVERDDEVRQTACLYTAEPLESHYFPDDAKYEFTVVFSWKAADEPEEPVDPVEPELTHVTPVNFLDGVPACSDYEIPDTEGVNYDVTVVDEDEVRTITITATPLDGYTFGDAFGGEEVVVWVHRFDFAECGVKPEEPTDPPVEEPTPPGDGKDPTTPPGDGKDPTTPPGDGKDPTTPPGDGKDPVDEPTDPKDPTTKPGTPGSSDDTPSGGDNATPGGQAGGSATNVDDSSADESADQLPYTGASVEQMALSSLGLLVLGVLFVTAARRRVTV